MSETHAERTANARETHDRLRDALRQSEDERERLQRRVQVLEDDYQREHDDADRVVDELLERIRSLEDELAVSKRLNGAWMDASTEAIMRAERSEAKAEQLKRHDGCYCHAVQCPHGVYPHEEAQS